MTENGSRYFKNTVWYGKRKKKHQKRAKKQRKDLERKENERGKINVTLLIKNKAEGIVQKWLGFFKRNLNKIANLNQKT